MNIQAYLDTVLQTTEQDWFSVERPVFLQDLQQVSSADKTWIVVQEHDRIHTLKSNLSMSIAVGLPHRDRFQVDWARKFPDENASSEYVDLLWCGRPFIREIRVIVDGGRAGLPIPLPGTMDVPERRVDLFRLVEELAGGSDFDRYFAGAGLRSVKVPWPS